LSNELRSGSLFSTKLTRSFAALGLATRDCLIDRATRPIVLDQESTASWLWVLGDLAAAKDFLISTSTGELGRVAAPIEKAATIVKQARHDESENQW